MAAQRRVVIVADDLTGAMDSSGPFAARGIKTWVVAMPMRCDPALLESARVVSVNTETRHLPATEAAARVREIVRHLGCERFNVVVKKIDSTLRGNVAAETLALMDASGRREAVVAAAFPAQGRTVRDGRVLVDGKPLAETAFARDALSPPPLMPATFLVVGLVGIELGDHQRFTIPFLFATSVFMTFIAVAFGLFSI